LLCRLARTTAGRTALHVAVQFQQSRCVRSLVRAGADLSVQDSQGRTPVDLAEVEEDQELKDILQKVEGGARM
jgi:ankyrin repeat protein